MTRPRPCPYCMGTGHIFHLPCHNCDGTGITDSPLHYRPAECEPSDPRSIATPHEWGGLR